MQVGIGGKGYVYNKYRIMYLQFGSDSGSTWHQTFQLCLWHLQQRELDQLVMSPVDSHSWGQGQRPILAFGPTLRLVLYNR